MLRSFYNWLERQVSPPPEIPAADWDAAFAALPLLDGLSEAERQRIRKLAMGFLQRKTISGAQGLEVSAQMALIIALQACLPVLSLGLGVYAGWSSVVVYPSGFTVQRLVTDEYGVEHQVDDELSGEAWQQGPVVLAWDEAEYGGFIDGVNLVIHEFAHKLDMQNGVANGFPPLHREMDIESWTEAFSRGFELMQDHCERGEDIGIDCYAATSPAEFFAVLSEAFFEQPEMLRYQFEAIYQQLRQYYRQDPLARLGG